MAQAVCEKCGGSGWRIIERDGISGAERCDCAPAASAQDLEAAARIPPQYADKSLDNFLLPSVTENPVASLSFATTMRLLRSFIREFPLGPKPGLMLIGPTGTGKTHLAVGVLREFLKRGFEGVFYDYVSLLASIRSSYDDLASAADRGAYQTCLDAPLLMIDDLGSQRAKDWVIDTVTGIISHRYNHKKPLIATAKLPEPALGDITAQKAAGSLHYQIADSLADRIGESARSRLFEMCEVIRLPDVGDYRLKKMR